MQRQTSPKPDLRYYGDSHVGLKRSNNEDCYTILELNTTESHLSGRAYLFVVADGIGGHAYGDVASRIACATLSSLKGYEIPVLAKDGKLFFENLFFSIDSKLKDYTVHHQECEDMGTTLSCLLLTEKVAILAHVGDSRIYRLRDGSFEQLTTDHTFVQEMIDMGEEPPEAVKYHPLRNVLTRAVGTQERLNEVDTKIFTFSSGDRFLLCTDGLHGTLELDQIFSAMMNSKNPKASVVRLMKEAITSGGSDNITLISVFV